MQNQCTMCNEEIHPTELQFGDAIVTEDDEYWHKECYLEYFGEPYPEELAVH